MSTQDALTEQLTEKYGILMNHEALAELLDRSVTSLRHSLNNSDDPTVQLLKETQKPVRRRPIQRPEILREKEHLRRHHQRQQSISDHKQAEGRQLQKRGSLQEPAPRQQLGGNALEAQNT